MQLEFLVPMGAVPNSLLLTYLLFITRFMTESDGHLKLCCVYFHCDCYVVLGLFLQYWHPTKSSEEMYGIYLFVLNLCLILL